MINVPLAVDVATLDECCRNRLWHSQGEAILQGQFRRSAQLTFNGPDHFTFDIPSGTVGRTADCSGIRGTWCIGHHPYSWRSVNRRRRTNEDEINSPIFVIDGVITTNIDNLNSEDIETISVL